MEKRLKNYFLKTPENQRKSEVIAFLASLDALQTTHPEIANQIASELLDQRSYLKLIASENFSSLSTQLAMGNLLTDKYSEGYPRHRFYAGCEHVDAIEEQAAICAKKLFNAPHAYVQPHSGADANLVAFWAILQTRIEIPGLEKLQAKRVDDLSDEAWEKIRQELVNQKIMGLSLRSGGHLTHGYRHNISAKMMRAVTYDVDPQTHFLDYDAIAKMAKRERPLILLAGYSAYTRHIDFAKMRQIADDVGAVLMTDMAHFAGLVAGGAFKNENHPFPYSHIATSTTHKTLRGPRGGIVLCQEEFTESVNRGCPLVLGGPLPHVMAAKAVAFSEATHPSFKSYAKNVVANAKLLAKALEKEGLALVTGGTDNHMILIDLSPLKITGRQGEKVLRQAGLTLNRNTIPFDQKGAWYTSGIRLGTPAITTLGMGTDQMQQIGKIIATVLKGARPTTNPKTGGPSLAHATLDEQVLKRAQEQVKELLSQFPLYPEIPLEGNLR